MKTRIVTLFITLLMVGSGDILLASNTQVDGIWYDFDTSTKTASVTYQGDSYTTYSNRYSGSVVIPASVTYNGVSYIVTNIGEGAFYLCSGLTSVTIGNSVTSIGEWAFSYCSSLTSITIPNSVTSIEAYAFYNCSGLTSVTIPNSVTSIGKGAFADCSGLTSVAIPNSVTSIGDYAFNNCRNLPVENNIRYADTYLVEAVDESLTSYVIKEGTRFIGSSAFSNCTGLTSVTIPNSVTSIGGHAFSGCRGLTSVTIPNSVTSIGERAFSECSSLTSVTIPNSVTSIVMNAFYHCTGLTSVTIPNSVTSIEMNAFYHCTGLTSVTIPNSVTSIESGAFAYCCGLTSVTIPNSVTSIESGAFAYCCGLTSIVVESGNSVYDSRNDCNAIIETASNTLIASCQSTIIPNSVTSIGGEAFRGCSGLTSVTIPNSVTSIGDYAFRGCSGLTSVTIPNSVTSIGDYAFCDCSSLTSVTIPNSVTSIGDYAFEYCSGLTSVTIGNSVTSIGSGAFLGCSGLTSIEIPNSVTSIGSSAFSDCSSLTSVTIPNSVTSIGDNAFENFCNIVYNGTATGSPWGARSINGYVDGYLVYSDNTKTTLLACSSAAQGEIVIPNSVTRIVSYAFSDCSGLTSVTIPNSVTSIGYDAFYGCSAVKLRGDGLKLGYVDNCLVYAYDYDYVIGINIDDSTRLISDNLLSGRCMSGNFENLKAITVSKNNPNYCSVDGVLFNKNKTTLIRFPVGRGGRYSIPNSVTSIGEEAFACCDGLTSVTIPNSVTSIGSYAFAGCDGLTSVTIPNSVTSIGDEAFDGCTGLTSVTIPNSVTKIGKGVFWRTGIEPPHKDSILYINNCSFGFVYSCVRQDIVIKKGTRLIADGAFEYDTDLRSITIPKSVTNIGSDAFPPQARLIFEMAYNAYVVSSDSTKGGVNTRTISGSEIVLSAQPQYGYHFEGWSDGDSANPRSLILSKDTSLTAKFAPNIYKIKVSCEDVYGNIEGENGEFPYLTSCTYKATMQYGYHFLHWSDGVTDNPRTLIVGQDSNIVAICEPNKYSIFDNSNPQQGYIAGKGAYDYLTPCSLTAVPKEGYHFVQWIDGNSQNPRSLTLTRDTSFTALFEISRSGTCGRGNKLKWEYNKENKTLTISGEGAFSENVFYGIEAAGEMETLIIGDGVTTIADAVFDNCTTLQSVIVHSSLPPSIYLNTFHPLVNTSAILYVHRKSKGAYKKAEYWGNFKKIKSIKE